ncbi:F-box/FBD/LRR-repeat protein At2g26030-like [Arabidopsis lyrata subsp. lyrata]|uniref:F-box/FBD/LRR-repeat protein At2g26030-like n=1 Tax=Arabidopsis lyrata subsp. lyrata TaxID=81972 RepID=UPI000A29EA6E|nr:F-box/FBD/LRR-repeat protein At2g26030-like [Arabidopsis lyrata subsp. lyrata]XP_020880350.1 F-box/FBD/LRR-repeat protein At2g26030-like [Arabidopsis lyrata subsp. lyrata]|eukprot:XP_020880341.1 F-box/FBD/LRR-repeat protein At2g26030-like [Arabidopsis lyrata subsp. lyrata]
MDCDRISELPDSLLTQILSYLPTKVSVTTSVLSKRWENLWLRVPGLDFTVNDELPPASKCLVSFIDNFMEFSHTLRMKKFLIKYHGNIYNYCGFMKWIGPAVDRGIQHLSVESLLLYNMPHNIYQSKTLVSLKLVAVGLENPEFVVSLPCLKTMYLENVLYCHNNPLFIEKLISGCPVLEELTFIKSIYYNRLEVLQLLRVRSQSLKSFHFTYGFQDLGKAITVEIDAPQLKYMNIRDNQSDRIVAKNLRSLFMIDIDTIFNVNYGSRLLPGDLSKRDIIRDFLTGISSVRHMIISHRTLKILYRYSKLGPFPKFDNLYRLEASISSSMLQFLTVFLESCPNLKYLILDFVVSTGPEQIELKYVPPCLLLNLECVEIKELMLEEQTGKKLVKYFLENSVVLKKLNMRFRDSPTINQASDISKELLTFTNRSHKCQISINGRSV